MDSESEIPSLNGSAILKTLKQYELVNIHSPNFNVHSIVRNSINKNFKITDGEQTLLLKIFNKENDLPISRKKVFKLQEELAILGLAPVPIFLNDENTMYCEQWIEFSKYEGGNLIKLLADSLHSVHSSFISAPLLALDEHWQSYWQKLVEPSEALEQQYKFIKEYWQIYVDVNRDQFVLCHNDLHIEHLSYANGPLFDWEYAGLGCRYFDIASCCAINQLEPVQIHELCEQYAELANQDSKDVIERVNNSSQLVSFTYNLWEASLGIENNMQ